MYKFLIFISLIFLSFNSFSQENVDEVRHKNFMKDRVELLILFRATPRLTEIDHADVIQFIDQSKGQVFLVTKAGHPAHPAIVTQQVLEVNGQLAVKMDGDGGGNKEKLKIWINHMQSEMQKVVDAKRKQ